MDETTTEDSRVLAASKEVVNAQVGKRNQLMTSDFFRHETTVFAEQIKDRTETSCLIVGLGNLQEPLRYAAQYYQDKGTLEGLNMQLVDLVEQSYFQELTEKPSTFSLGKNEDGTPKTPDNLASAFDYDPISGEYVAKDEIKSFIRSAVDKGKYKIHVKDIRSSGLSEKTYDYVSCQNVLGYVPKLLLDTTLVDLSKFAKPEGILALRTDSANDRVGLALERQKVGVSPVPDQMGIYKLNKDGEEVQPLGFIAQAEAEKKKVADNVARTGNIFGIPGKI